MALTTALDGINIAVGETTEGGGGGAGAWDILGGGSAEAFDDGVFIQGSAAVGSKISSERSSIYFEKATGLDFTTTYAGYCVYIWVNCTTIADLDTIQNGGISILLGTGGTTNYSEWYVLGSDTQDVYNGGWIRVFIDPRQPPSSVTGTGVDLTDVDIYGVSFDVTALAKSNNCFVDRIDVAKGLRLYGTSTDGWDDVFDADMGTQANKYGILQKRDGFFYAYGNLEVGDDQSTNATTMTSQDTVIRWVSQYYYLDSNNPEVPSCKDDFMGIRFVDNGTGATSYTDGVKIAASESGRNGNYYWGSENTQAEFDATGLANAASFLGFYGGTLNNLRKPVLLESDTDHEFWTMTVFGSGQVRPGSASVRNCVFATTVDTYAETFGKVWAYDDGAGTPYTDDTTAAGNATTNDMTLWPTTPAANDAYYFGDLAKFSEVFVEVSTAGSGVTGIWEYYNGSAWTTLHGSSTGDAQSNANGWDQARSGETFGVFFTPPSDWATVAVNSVTGYYVRYRATAVSTPSQALGQQAWVGRSLVPDGAAMLWDASMDTEDCSFAANADDDNDPSAVQHDTAGTYTYTGLLFGGNDYDVLNNSAASLMDYDVGSIDAAYALNATQYAFGQSFTGDGGTISRVLFYMSKVGSPTGNMYAGIYTHTGTFGSTGTPTTPLLALSNLYAASSVSTTAGGVYFEFEDEFVTTNTTKYFVIVYYAGGGASDYLNVWYDNTSPAHGGNAAGFSTTVWTAQSGWDAYFVVLKGGIVKINATGSNPASAIERQLLYPGATILENSVNLKLDVRDSNGDPITGAYAAIYDEDEETELMNELTLATGLAEQSYNYPGTDQDIYWRIRESGTQKNARGSGLIEDDGFSAIVTMVPENVS